MHALNTLSASILVVISRCFIISDLKITNGADYGRAHMIEHIDLWELPFIKVLLSCCEA